MTAQLAAFALLACLLAAISIEDGRSGRIPNVLNALLLAGGLGFSVVTGAPGLAASLAGAIGGAGFLAAVAMAFRRWRGIDGIGFGDVKFLAAAGAWVGWQGLSPLVFIAAMSALLVVGLRRLAGGRFHRLTEIAFGPHLSLATLVVWTAQAQGVAPWLPPAFGVDAAWVY